MNVANATWESTAVAREGHCDGPASAGAQSGAYVSLTGTKRLTTQTLFQQHKGQQQRRRGDEANLTAINNLHCLY